MAFSTFPNNPFPPSSAQFDEGKNEFIQAEIDAIKDGTSIDSFADVESALATKTNLSNIAPAFDATSGVYAVGDKIIYEDVLYEFISAHSTAGEWDESEVKPVKISELIDSLKNGLIGEIVAVGTGVSVYRQGAMRILKLYGAESDSIGVISELSAFDRPLAQVLNPCVYNDGTTKNGYIIVEATGEIKLLDVTTDTAVSGGRAFSMVSYYII